MSRPLGRSVPSWDTRRRGVTRPRSPITGRLAAERVDGRGARDGLFGASKTRPSAVVPVPYRTDGDSLRSRCHLVLYAVAGAVARSAGVTLTRINPRVPNDHPRQGGRTVGMAGSSVHNVVAQPEVRSSANPRAVLSTGKYQQLTSLASYPHAISAAGIGRGLPARHPPVGTQLVPEIRLGDFRRVRFSPTCGVVRLGRPSIRPF